MTNSTQKLRPAARLIKTIGQNLIKDAYAAIVELVKNAYDADSPDAVVGFRFDEIQKRLVISVRDRGHGMSAETVLNKWLVPATDDKLRRQRSENGRVLQGRKGIGRFAASILGERILLETNLGGVTTSLILDMEELERIEYLDELDIEVAVEESGKPNGTLIEIEKDNVTADTVNEIWNSSQLSKLVLELRSVIAPEEVYETASDQGFHISHDSFDIELTFADFPNKDYANRKIDVKPFPVLELYDFRIAGKVDESGSAILNFENQNVPGFSPENISLQIPIGIEKGEAYPGDIFVDLRVYDRDPESIDNFINRGLINPETGEFVGKRKAREILDEYYGIGIYREQFRVRPYGDQSFDWLDLDKKRVQNPSFRIGHNQIIGFVHVRPEEQSGLLEKSARDGLKENGAYFGLISIISQIIRELEVRRVRFREKTLKGGRGRTLEEEIDLLFDFEIAKKRISRGIKQLGITQQQKRNFEAVVDETFEDEKQKKSRYIRKIRDTIAIYQGQATLGKITHVLLHEGRKHIKFITETVPRIVKWGGQLQMQSDQDLEKRLEERSEKVLVHANGLAFLFSKLEPLARTRRSPKRNLSLEKELKSTFEIFSSELNDALITYEISAESSGLNVNANEMDLITVFSNLIENSIYWLSCVENEGRSIQINIFEREAEIVVEFEDTGPGFQGNDLELMFEPGYSTKPDGTGLGLALAGEAMSRIGGSIRALGSDEGAVIELVFEGEESG